MPHLITCSYMLVSHCDKMSGTVRDEAGAACISQACTPCQLQQLSMCEVGSQKGMLYAEMRPAC